MRNIKNHKNLDELFDSLPVFLRTEELSFLGLSRASLFNLVKTPGFPAIRCNKRIIIPKDKLRLWLENESKKPLAMYSYAQATAKKRY